MSALVNQTNLNTGRYFFLLANASTITAGNIFANTISTAQVNAQVVDADVISTIQFYADLVNIDEATISSISTNAVELDGGYLTTLNGNTLLLNGIPLATTQNISTLSDWSLDPAISTVKAANPSIDIGTSNQPFRSGYFSTIYAKDAVIQSTTLTLTETVSSLYVNDLFTSTITSQSASISSLLSQAANFSSITANSAYFSSISSQTAAFTTLTVSTANISSITGGASASNWYTYPAKGDVLFQPDILGNPLYSISSVKDITCGNITAQLYGFPVPVGGGVVSGVLGNFFQVQSPTGTFSNSAETADVSVYGVNKLPGFSALYVNGGLTVDGGVATHGITLGTNTAGVSLNRIDILPIGTQDYVTWGAAAHVAGLGMTFDAGLGINIAAGLVVDVLGQDVQLRANDTISLDADDGISLITGGTLSINANTLAQTANNFTFNDSNFTVNSSNQNAFNTSKVVQGTPLPPSTLGFYSTFTIASQMKNFPYGNSFTTGGVSGLFQNISTAGFVVTSNISTIYTPSTTGLVSTYTSTITSSFQRGYSTLSILQDFPVGQVNLALSSLLLQHAYLIELDTKPFPIFTTLTPGLSTVVSSLYTYEQIYDGGKYSEIGNTVQTIVPVVNTISSYLLSTGTIGSNVVSTLTSSFFSSLVSQTTFTSSIYNQMLYNSNAFSTPNILASSINTLAMTYLNTRQPFIQYSTVTTSGGGGNVQVVLPVPYKNTFYASHATMNDSQPAQMGIQNNSRSTMTIYWSNGGGGTHNICWTTYGDVF